MFTYYLIFLKQLQRILSSKGMHNTLLHSFPDIGLDPIKLFASWSSLYFIFLKFNTTINFCIQIRIYYDSC